MDEAGARSDESAEASPAAQEDAGAGNVRPESPGPAGAATGADAFWTCGQGVHAMDDPTPFGQENALQRLGKPPFEKSTRGRFRLLGYLATVYEHVSQDVGAGLGGDATSSLSQEGLSAEPMDQGGANEGGGE